MYFRSQSSRIYWIIITSFLLVDIVIGAILAWYFGAGIFVVIAFVLVMQLILPFFYFLRALLGWTIFFNLIKNNVTQITLTELKENNFPEPKEVEDSAIDYLNTIISSKKLKRKIIACAAFTEGYLKGITEVSGLSGKIFFSAYTKGLEDALVEYKNNFKKK